MSVKSDLSKFADLCEAAAKAALEQLFALGPRPEVEAEALLWDQQRTRLQGQINSLTALGSKVTAAAILAGLEDLQDELKVIGQVTADAKKKIAKVKQVSAFLVKGAVILDLGIAILGAATTGANPATISAIVKAGKGVATTCGDDDEKEAKKGK